MESAKTKTTALLQAKNALKDYLKRHNLNPMKDWRKDKVNGKEVTRLVTRLNLERDKVLDNYPYNDIHNETKLVKMKEKKQKAEKEAKKAKKAAKEATANVAKAPKKEETEKAQKEKKAKAATPTKYNYPLIDGREMTADEKKKYRAEQRRLANKGEAKPKKEKEAKAAKKVPAVPEKPLKEKKAKKDKKKSKAKDED
jgi:hypothetical protein